MVASDSDSHSSNDDDASQNVIEIEDAADEEKEHGFEDEYKDVDD